MDIACGYIATKKKRKQQRQYEKDMYRAYNNVQNIGSQRRRRRRLGAREKA